MTGKAGPEILIIFGPTGVGKTELLSFFPENKIEVISGDSMQVYRYLNIGTAKPGKKLLEKIPHHLIDIIDPKEQYDTGRFVQDAENLVSEIHERGKLPVISGGTPFYFTNFLYGMPETPKADPEIRAAVKKEYETEGLPKLSAELRKIDPESAQRIHPADTNRLLRAIEVYRQTGRPLSSYRWERETGSMRKDAVIIGLNRPREELYDRINRRVEQMFHDGLAAEVEGLVKMGYTSDDPGLKGIGYREFFQLSEGPKEKIKQSTRKYAKRQLTFFKRIDNVHWFHPDEKEKIAEILRQFDLS